MAKYKVGDILKFNDGAVGIIAEITLALDGVENAYLVLYGDVSRCGWLIDEDAESSEFVANNAIYKQVKPKNQDKFTKAWYYSEWYIDSHVAVLPQSSFSDYFTCRDAELGFFAPHVSTAKLRVLDKPEPTFNEAIEITREIEGLLSQVKTRLDQLEEMGCDVFIDNVEGELIRVVVSKGAEEYSVYSAIEIE